MKLRAILWLMLVALVMTNCNNDEDASVALSGGISQLTATVEGRSRSTMTDEGEFLWAEGDVLSVYDENTNGFVKFVCGENNVFGIADDEEVTSVDPSGYAIYPAGSHSYINNTISVVLPSNYENKSTSYTPNTNAIMLAEVDESNQSTLSFKHLGGLMKFVVKNVPAGANQFKFTSLNKQITGTFDLESITENENSVNVVKAKDINGSNNNTVIVSFTELASAVESMTFFIPLPVGEYTGYKVEITGTNVNLSNISTTDIVNKVGRCSLLLMPTFTCTANNLEKTANTSIAFGSAPNETQNATITGGVVSVDASNANADATATLNLNYTPSENDPDPTLTISDGSNNGESEKSDATVNVYLSNDAEVSELNINAPTLTVELNVEANGTAATYETVTAKTAVNTLKINEGITINKLVLNGGHIVIASGAYVNTFENAEGFSGKTYVVCDNPESVPQLDNVEYVPTEGEMKLKAAYDAGWEEYSLDSEVLLSKQFVIERDFMLHLNGYTIKNEAAIWDDVVKDDWSLISVQGEGVEVTIDGNGEGTLQAKENDCYAVDVRGGATVTLKDGTFVGNISAVYVHEGTANILNGTYSIQQQSNDSRYTLNCLDENYQNGTANIVVTGGIFENGFNPANNLAEGEGTDFVKVGSSSMPKDGNKYEVEGGIKNEAALRTAIAKAEANGFVPIGDADIILTEPLVINKNITLHLNGYTIKNEIAIFDDVVKDDWSLISVQGEDVQVTIEGGTVQALANDCYAVDVRDGATVTLKDGKFIGNISAVYVHDGTANILSGTYSIQQKSTYNDSRYTLNCLDENYQNNTANIVVTGGTFEGGFNPANNLAEGEGTDFVAVNYSSMQRDNGNFEVEGGIKNEAALLAAIAKTEENGIIELTDDLTLSSVILIDKSIKIVGGTHTITSSASRIFRLTQSNISVFMEDVNMVSTAIQTGTNDVRGISIDTNLSDVSLTLTGCSVVFDPASGDDWAYAVNICSGCTKNILSIIDGSYQGANVINVWGNKHTVTIDNATLKCLYVPDINYKGACVRLEGTGVSLTVKNTTYASTYSGNLSISTKVDGNTIVENNNTDNIPTQETQG